MHNRICRNLGESYVEYLVLNVPANTAGALKIATAMFDKTFVNTKYLMRFSPKS